MSRTLQLIFQNDEGRSVTISMADAREDLEAAEVEAVMNNICQRNLFSSSGGDLAAPVRAQVVSREVETLVEF